MKTLSRSQYRFYIRTMKSKIFATLVITFGLAIFSLLLLIVFYLGQKGITELSFDFLFNTPKAASEIGGGILNAIVGSILIVLGSILFSLPFGIIAGVVMAEFEESNIALTLHYFIDLLLGTPSILLGIFSYTILVLTFKTFSGIAGSFALSLLIIPIIAKSLYQSLKLIHVSIREAGYALGLSKIQIINVILLPGTKSGLITGILLALSRAIGETAPLLFTAFGNNFLSYNLFGPMASLPVQIYNYSSSPYLKWQNQAWSGALILIITIFTVNLGSKLYLEWSKK